MSSRRNKPPYWLMLACLEGVLLSSIASVHGEDDWIEGAGGPAAIMRLAPEFMTTLGVQPVLGSDAYNEDAFHVISEPEATESEAKTIEFNCNCARAGRIVFLDGFFDRSYSSAIGGTPNCGSLAQLGVCEIVIGDDADDEGPFDVAGEVPITDLNGWCESATLQEREACEMERAPLGLPVINLNGSTERFESIGLSTDLTWTPDS